MTASQAEDVIVASTSASQIATGEPDGAWPPGSLHGLPYAPRLAERRHCAKLLEPAEHILVAPMIDDLAACNAEDRGRRERERSTAWRNAHERAAGIADNCRDRLFAGGKPAGYSPNGEMSQNTALAGLLSRDTQMRELAGDIP